MTAVVKAPGRPVTRHGTLGKIADEHARVVDTMLRNA